MKGGLVHCPSHERSASERGEQAEKTSRGDRWARLIGPMAIALCIGPLLLAGCQGFGQHVKPPPAISLPLPPKSPVTVPLGFFRMEVKRYVTPLEYLAVRSVNEDQLLWHSRPRTTDWATVPRQGEGLSSSIALVEEGRHLFQ